MQCILLHQLFVIEIRTSCDGSPSSIAGLPTYLFCGGFDGLNQCSLKARNASSTRLELLTLLRMTSSFASLLWHSLVHFILLLTVLAFAYLSMCYQPCTVYDTFYKNVSIQWAFFQIRMGVVRMNGCFLIMQLVYIACTY